MKKLITFIYTIFFVGVLFMNAQNAKLTQDTLFGTSQKTGLEYVLKVNPDRLLSTSYSAMGQKPKAAPYGGWEAPVYGGWQDRTLRGHSLGHYLSALSGFYSATGSTEAKEKLDYTVSEIKKLQRKDGFFDAIPSTPFDQVFTGNFTANRFDLNGWWVPWYAIHKIYAGLIDAYTLGQNKDALEIVTKMSDWAVKGLKNLSDEQFQLMLTCEHGGMCKAMADMYEITGNKEYLALAERFIHQEIVKPLIKQVDKLQGYHANTQMPKIIGLAKLYELTGKAEYRTACEFFFKTVTENRSYAIGGNSKGEHFGLQFDEPLERDTCETCNTYNMLELTEHLFAWNKTSYYADYYETALYNHILASQDPDSGAKTYFIGMMPGFFKIYGDFNNAWWCCTGTGMENPERYGRFIAKDYENTIYINLFIPCTFETDDGWKIQISGNFPYEQKTTIKVLSEGKNKKTLKIRSPKWIEKNKTEDGYITLSSDLKNSDTFEYELPMKLNTRRTRDRSGNFSIFYGPVLLAADLGTKGMPYDIVENQLCYMTQPGVKISVITADPLEPSKWIDLKDNSKLIFETKSEASEKNVSYTLKPFYAIHHTRYSTYFNTGTGKEDLRANKYADITTDFIEPGRQQSEVEHHGKYSDTEMGYIPEVDRNYRQITGKEGSITYRIKFDAKSPKLVLSFWGKDKGSITINADSKEISTIKLNGDKGNELYDVEILMPEDLIQAKAKKKTTAAFNVILNCKEECSLKLCEIRAVK